MKQPGEKMHTQSESALEHGSRGADFHQPDIHNGPGKSALRVIWRRKLTVIAVAAAGIVGAGIYGKLQTKEYRSSSQILVEQTGHKIINDGQADTAPGANNLSTQCEVLKSTHILAVAMAMPGIRELPAFSHVANPVALIKTKMLATPGLNDDTITVSFDSPFASDGAKVVNAIIDAYTAMVSKKDRAGSTERLAILHREKEKADIDLDARTTALIDFKKTHGVVSYDKDSVTTRQMSALSEAITAAHIDVINAKSAFDEAARRVGDPAVVSQYLAGQRSNEISAMVAGMDSTQISAELYNQQQRLRNLTGQYMPDHPEIRGLRLRIQQLNLAYLQSLQDRWTSLRQREQELSDTMRDQEHAAFDFGAQAAEYSRLEGNVKSQQEYCDLLGKRLKEIDVNEDVSSYDVTVLEPATAGLFAVHPQVRLLMFQGALLGLLAGCGIVLLDRRFRSAEEIATAMGVPVMGVVPHIAGKSRPLSRARLMRYDTSSEIAEAYRAVRTAIFFGLREQEAKTILITSPVPGDGKTTLAANLATAMAHAGQRVLLIDSDFRRPRQHAIFEVGNEVGLSDVLANAHPWEQAVQHTEVRNLDVLPAGPTPAQPAELLNSDAFADLLETFCGQYDYILLDSPPVLAATDARILGAMCDVTLLVLRAEKSVRRASIFARDRLLSVGARILGTVINDAPRLGAGRGSYSAYGFEQYGYRDRETKQQAAAYSNGNGHRDSHGEADEHHAVEVAVHRVRPTLTK